MRIKELTGNAISALYESCGRQVFFHPDWIKSVGGKTVLAAYENDELLGGAWFYHFGRFGFQVACNAPFTPYNPLFIVENSAIDKGTIIESLIRTGSKKLLDIGLTSENSDWQPDSNYFSVDHRPTYLLHLAFSESELFAALSSSTRNKLNKTARTAYSIAINGNRADALMCYRDTMERVGRGFPKTIAENLLAPNLSQLVYSVNVYFENTIAASCMVAYDQKTAYYLSAGRAPQSNDSLAGTLALWKAICHAKELGIESFDFCGSTIPGVARFFESFGANKATCLRLQRGHKTQETLKFFRQKLT